jgi:hypothetical protein
MAITSVRYIRGVSPPVPVFSSPGCAQHEHSGTEVQNVLPLGELSRNSGGMGIAKKNLGNTWQVIENKRRENGRLGLS